MLMHKVPHVQRVGLAVNKTGFAFLTDTSYFWENSFYEKAILFLCVFIALSVFSAFAQQSGAVISGTVYDENAEPFQGVMVVVAYEGDASTNVTYTVSDVNGEFSLPVPTGGSGNLRVMFQYTGYEVATYKVPYRSHTFTVTLYPEVIDLD